MDDNGQHHLQRTWVKQSRYVILVYLMRCIIININKTTGPIPLASYMRQCLTSPDGGYYTSVEEGRDQFGRKGDFITSPEISQVFGELVGLWIVAEWISQGKKSSGINIIEAGPGRGTLVSDLLRVCILIYQTAWAVSNLA